MPKDQRDIPIPIQHAMTALEQLRAEDTALAASVEKALPGYAMSLERSGMEVTVDVLLNAARQGLKLQKQKAEPEDVMTAYERIVTGLSGLTLTPERQMEAAFAAGDLDKIRQLIDRDRNLLLKGQAHIQMFGQFNNMEVVDNYDNKNVVLAAAGGYTAVLEFLVNEGVDIAGSLHSAFIHAARNGHMETAKFLMQKGDITEKCMKSALWEAVKNGHLNMVKFLRTNGVDVASMTDFAGCLGTDKNIIDVVKYLHESGVSMGDKRTLLFAVLGIRTMMGKWANRGGYVEVVKYLCENNNYTAEDLAWPGVCAIKNGNTEILKYFYERGLIDIDRALSTRTPDDPLEAAAEGGHLEMLQFLHEIGVDVTKGFKSYKYYSPLSAASAAGQREVVQYLLSLGADVTDEFGGIGVIHRALFGKHYELALYLREQGARVDSLTERELLNLRSYEANNKLWHEVLRMSAPAGLEFEDPRLFKKVAFEAVVQILEKEGYKSADANLVAFSTAVLFGSEQRVLQYLEKWGEAGKQPLHDLIYMIKLPEGGAPNLKDWGDAVLKCGPSMARLVKFSDKLPSPLKTDDGRTWSMQNTRAEVAKYAFNRAAEHPALAALCFEHDVEEKAFNDALDIATGGPYPKKNIPDIVVDGEIFDMPGAKFYRLADDDIRGLFLGEMTDCCQSIGGAGEECADFGYTSGDGAFFVLQNAKRKIIGQTWAWRGEKGEMCFDSLEFLGNQVTPQQWTKIATEVARQLDARTDHNVTAFHIGTGGKTPDSELRQVFKNTAEAKPKGYNGYRDSNGPQIMVWKR